MVSAPYGWILITPGRLNGGANVNMAVYYNIATSSEPASYTFTFVGSSPPAVLGVINFAGVDPNNPLDVANGMYGSVPTSNVLTPSITTTVNNAMIVASFGNRNTDTWTPPTEMTEQIDKAAGTVFIISNQRARWC